MNHIEFVQKGLHNRHIIFLLKGAVHTGVVIDDRSHTEGKTKDTHYTFVPTQNLQGWRNSQAHGDVSAMHGLSSVVDIEDIIWGVPYELGRQEKLFNEAELISYISHLLHKKSGLFRNVRLQITLPNSHFRPDIFVELQEQTQWVQLIIEVKSFTSFTGENLLTAIRQLEEYRKALPGSRLVLLFPGMLPAGDMAILERHQIQVWDIGFVGKLFLKEIEESPHPILQPLFLENIPNEPRENSWIAELKSIKPGKEEWGRYQSYVERILEYLFGAQLSSPITQHADHFGINRPDFILRNYADTGFWSQLRTRYQADFIVVDAKNHANEIKKGEVIQISNYLKVHGAGLFGIIFTRRGRHDSAYYTCREVWAMDKKMIIVLDDEDLQKMILAFETTHSPEEIVRQKIEEFRLSM